MSESKYQYSEVILLKTPQKYQMTPYDGINFLKNYKKSIQSVSEVMSLPISPNLSKDKINLVLDYFRLDKING